MQSMKAKFSLAIFPSQFVFYSYNQYCIVVYDGFLHELISKQSFASQTFVVCNSGTVLCYIYTQQLSVSHCTYFHTHVVPLCLSHYCIHRSLQPVKVRIVNLQVTATVPYQLFPLTPTPPSLPHYSSILHQHGYVRPYRLSWTVQDREWYLRVYSGTSKQGTLWGCPL